MNTDDTEHGPLAPPTEQRLRLDFSNDLLMHHLGARLDLLSTGQVQVVLPRRAELIQQRGHFHAGASGAIAGIAGEYAALTVIGPDGVVVVEYKLNLVAPADRDQLEAVGTVVRAGRTLIVSRLEVFSTADGGRRLVALGQQTLLRIHEHPAPH